MDGAEFKRRTRAFAIGIIELIREMPRDMAGAVLGRQLVRSATSVGANYRAACRARSAADVVAKLKIVEEEADETLYWLERLVEAGLLEGARVDSLHAETNEIVAMTIASIKTLRSRAAVLRPQAPDRV